MIVEHIIQKQILDALTKAKALRFSQLKPAGLESNIFMYHLKQLIKSGLVEKVDGAYCLGLAGLTYVDQLSSTNLRPRLQPKVIAILVVQNQEGKVALLRRKVQPYIDHYMLPSGKIHFGESQTAHAARELQEKLGIETALSVCGVAAISISKDSHVLTHVLATVTTGSVKNTKLHCKDPRFIAEWVDTSRLESLLLMPGTAEILQLAKTRRNFAEDLHYQLPT